MPVSMLDATESKMSTTGFLIRSDEGNRWLNSSIKYISAGVEVITIN